VKILIAGLGSVGRRHLRNLRQLGESDILLFRTHQATLPEEELQGLPVETDLERALAWQPQAVIVANPTALHMQVAVPAARQGCHILLEKPVSDSLEQLDELQSAAASSGSRIQVGFQFRFHPTLRKAGDLIRAGAVGQVLTAHVHWGEYLPGWHPWEDYRRAYAARADLGGGVIVTLTHPLDYLRWLIGEVEALWSFNGHISALEVDVEDVAEIGLRFTGGAIGGVHLNFIQRPAVHRLEIAGSAGTLRWDNADGVLKLARFPAPFGSWAGQSPAPVEEQFVPPKGFERNTLFLEQMRAFLAVVRGEALPDCTLADGRRALEIALGARLSAASGAVFHLPAPG